MLALRPDQSTRRSSSRFALVLLVALLAMLLAACADAPTSTLPPPQVLPTSETAVPTATAAPALLPPPVVLPATPTAVPTQSAPEPTAEPEEQPVTLLAPADFGADRSRLTGDLVDDPAVLARRPIACKLSNFPAQHTRPQSGPNDADLVFEHMTEGGLTRWTAIFYSQTPPDIGPIRSARLIDVELPAMYDAALCFSGASTGVSSRLNASDFRDRILRSTATGYYRTGANKPYEHTFYANPVGLWQALDGLGQNRAPAFGSQMAFSSLTPSGGDPGGSLSVDYRSEQVIWRYDGANGRYWRWTDGAPHVDANTGEQLNFSNVVVVKAVQVDDANICEEIRDNRCVALSVEIQLWGRGEAIVLRDGQAYTVTWRRENRNDMLTFFDGAGNSLPLQLGNTFFQVVPANLQGYPVTVE